MATVLIAGGTGLIGMHLSELLARHDHRVIHLSRETDLSARFPAYHWDIEQQTISEEAIRMADYVINLAGAGIADKRWSAERKKVIIDSRVDGTQLLREAFARYNHRPKAYLAASAIGYYGDRGEEYLTEQARPGNGFLSESTILWERAIADVAAMGIRTVVVRTGIVLSPEGGALEKMLQPTQFFGSPYFGDGQQWYSWIHIDDIADIYRTALEDDSYEGVYNAVAPHPARNKDLAEAIKQATEKPLLVMPVPTFALKLALGEMTHTILDSTKVSAHKIREAGYTFQHPKLLPALQDLLSEENAG